jgi:hypothetical protein
MKLITMKGDSKLTKRSLEHDFEKQMKAKNILCKLPIIDMKKNTFRFGGADARGGATMFPHP